MVSINPVGGVWTFYVEPGVSRFLPLPGSYGMLRLRDKTRAAVFAVRHLGAREAKARLAKMASVKKVKAGGKPGRQKGRK